MAVYTAPTTRTTGALISASIWNTDVVENIKYFKDAPVFDGDISVGDDLLFTSSGAVINFDSGDVTITHSSNTLTFGGATTGYVFTDGPVKTATTISVGAATPAATGAGITFPASQSASSDANTLDDYEEGTWTATLKGSTTDPTTPVTATGTYTKIGRQVTVQVTFNNVTTTGAAGDVTVTGLPFTVTKLGLGAIACHTFDLNGGSNYCAYPTEGTTTVNFLGAVDDAGWVNLRHNAGSSRFLWFSLSYTV